MWRDGQMESRTGGDDISTPGRQIALPGLLPIGYGRRSICCQFWLLPILGL